MQVDEVKGDYRSIVGWWRWWVWPDPESYVFSQISRGKKPSSRLRIGELTYSSVTVTVSLLQLLPKCTPVLLQGQSMVTWTLETLFLIQRYVSACMHAYVCACVRVCMSACMHVCACLCMCVCTKYSTCL